MDEAVNDQYSFNTEGVARLEEAANVLMSPSSDVTQDARKAAELFFLDIRNGKLSPECCRLVIETTSNEFVIFEMVQSMVLTLFKKWSVLDPLLIRQCFEYLLGSAVQKFRAPKLIRGEMLRACAKLLKRSIFDGKACDEDSLDRTIQFLLTNNDPQLQLIGCEFIEAIANEFSSSWRTANLGITFDFHLRARRAFEGKGLQRLFEKCLRTFSELVLTADLTSPYNMSLCENFLRVGDFVLSWNFEGCRLPVRLIFASEGSPASSLRPPLSWKPIFQSDQFLHLFFELHKRVRHNETLCLHSMNCLVQLASLMGPVLSSDPVTDPEKPGTSGISATDAVYERYVSNFIAGFVNIFGSGPLEDEVLGLCLMVYKLLTYHRILCCARVELFPTFVDFLVRYIDYLTPIAMKKALEEDEYAYIEGLQRLYEGWWVILRNSDTVVRVIRTPVDFGESTLAIVSAFTRAVLSEPLGCRSKIPVQECDDDNNEDDREVYKELLDHIGRFSSFYCALMLPRMYTVLYGKLKQFMSFIESGVSEEGLDVWREDMHWILLLIGFIVTCGEEDGSALLQSDVLDYYEKEIQKNDVDVTSIGLYIKTCIDSPNAIHDSAQFDFLTKIFGNVLAWCSVEHKLLVERGPEAISPELARTSLWCARRLTFAFGMQMLNYEDGEQLAAVTQSFSQTVVDFGLQKSFAIFNRLSGERKLCLDAVELLIGLVRTQSNETAKSAFLFPCLSTIQIERLPARHALLKVLVQVGAMVDDGNMQKTLYEMVLQPLRERYLLLCKSTTSLDTDLIDLLDCFRGIADAAHNVSTHFLFDYLVPILTESINLLSVHKESQLVTNAVLELFNVVTRRMGFYSEDRNDKFFLFEALLELVRVYQASQFSRYKMLDIDVEEKASDLTLLLEILGNVMSRDVISVNSTSEDIPEFAKSGSRVAITALEMLLPIMEDELLKLPSLCKKFYRFILYLSEMAPQCYHSLPKAMFAAIVECLRHGLKSGFGQEISMISAEAVAEIACYFAQNPGGNEAYIESLNVLIEPTFALCLSVSWQVELQTASATAMFSLICCSQAAFGKYVEQLLSRAENRQYQDVLHSAFQALLLNNTPLKLGRREKLDFRSRLHQFLEQVQGLLVVE